MMPILEPISQQATVNGTDIMAPLKPLRRFLNQQNSSTGDCQVSWNYIFFVLKCDLTDSTPTINNLGVIYCKFWV